ncbi:MAG: YcaO-like family protein [Bdellovibrionales bacterium]|nr:YcaO-like family protein [Bdellovibrionales bacterium]
MINLKNNFLLFIFTIRVHLFLFNVQKNFWLQKIELNNFLNSNGDKINTVLISVADESNEQGLTLSGAAKTFSQAYNKACSELAEVIAFRDYNLNWLESRSGWAAHCSLEKAIENSYLESIERDSLLMHILVPKLGTYPLKPNIYTNGKKIKLVKLQSVDPNIIVILAGVNHGKGVPWILGFGASYHERDAIDKALIECILLDESKEAFQSETVDARLRCWNNHLKQSCDGPVRDHLESIFDGSGSLKMDHWFDCGLFKNEYVKKVGSRWVVKGLHPDLLEFKFGQLWEKEMGKSINILSRRGLEVKKWITHPYV